MFEWNIMWNLIARSNLIPKNVFNLKLGLKRFTMFSYWTWNTFCIVGYFEKNVVYEIDCNKVLQYNIL